MKSILGQTGNSDRRKHRSTENLLGEKVFSATGEIRKTFLAEHNRTCLRPRLPAIAVFTAFFALSTPAQSNPVPGFFSDWSGGQCLLRGSNLTYQENSTGRYRTINVFEPIGRVDQLHCSDQYTAILSGDDIVITLGARPILEGRQTIATHLNFLNHENSYAISLPSYLAGQKPSSVQISGASLFLIAASGDHLGINLKFPKLWYFY